MAKFILVNRIPNTDNLDVILPNGRIYITLMRPFASVQELEEYIRDRVGLSFDRMHLCYELSNGPLADALESVNVQT
jgi:hypothetical protein